MGKGPERRAGLRQYLNHSNSDSIFSACNLGQALGLAQAGI